MPVDRRSFMKASGVAATLSVTALAGCNGFVGGGGSGAASWQYDPAALSDTQTRFFGSMQYGDLYEMRDELPSSMETNFEADDSSSSVSPEDLDLLTGVGGGQLSMETDTGAFFGSMVVTGSFDTDALASEIEADGEVTRTGEYEGYALYEGANFDQGMPGQSMPGQPDMSTSATIALSEEAIVFGVTVDQTGDLNVAGQQTVESMIDAEAGNAERLAANSDHVSELNSKLDGSMMVVGGEVDSTLVDAYQQDSGAGTGSQMLDGLRAGGFGADITPDMTTYDFAIVYEDSGAAEDSGIVSIVDVMGMQTSESEEINSIDANQDGATVVVTIEGDTQALLDQGQNQVPTGAASVGAIPTDF